MPTFQEALAIRVARSEFTIAELSRQTGIPKGQLDKLNQGRSKSTNVDDAQKILRFTGLSYEQFCDVSSAPDSGGAAMPFQQEVELLRKENLALRTGVAKMIVAAEQNGKIEIWLPGR